MRDHGHPCPRINFLSSVCPQRQSSLSVLRSRYIAWLQSPESDCIRLCDIAYTATTRSWTDFLVHVSSALCSELPPYSFSSAEFWVDFKEERPGLSSYLRGPKCHPSHLIEILSSPFVVAVSIRFKRMGCHFRNTRRSSCRLHSNSHNRWFPSLPHICISRTSFNWY
jgi:hypothetical protein